METNKIKRLSRDDWIHGAFKLLGQYGIQNVKIVPLAEYLGATSGSFYWHFKNRDDLLRQLLDYWTQELTEVLTANPEMLALKPKSRLIRTAEMIIDYELACYDMAIRQWALRDAGAARAVKKVNRLRLNYVRKAFSELGFKGEDLEMRTMLFVCYHSWESPMFPEISRKRRRDQIAQRIELLTRK